AGALRAVSRRARGCAGGWSARLGLQRARRAQHLDRDRPRVPGPRGDGLPGRRWAGDRGTRLDTRRTDARLRAWRPRQRTGRVPEPAVSPKGDRVAFLNKGQIWWAPLADSAKPEQLVHARGGAQSLRWSPDGSKLAFVSSRGDHGFVGVYDVATKALKFLDASVDDD